MNNKNYKTIIVICLFFISIIILFNASDFSSKISREHINKSDIGFANISIHSQSNGAYEKTKVDYYGDDLVGTVVLPTKTSEISYLITIYNDSDLDKCLLWLQTRTYSNRDIEYIISDYKFEDPIMSKENKNIIITFKFKKDIELINNDTLNFDIRFYYDTLDIKTNSTKSYINYSRSQKTFLNGPLNNNEIESISFSNNLSDISILKESWDVSKNNDNSIKAYYGDIDKNGLFEIVIYSNDTIAIEDLSYFCSDLEQLKQFSFRYLDISKVTSMSYMFNNCHNLNHIEFKHNDTSNITDISYMFNNCYSIGVVNLDYFEYGKLTNISGLFKNCKSLYFVTFANFNTKNVTNMESTFEGCSIIKNLHLSSFDTSNVTNVKNMFKDCHSLEKIYVSDTFIVSKDANSKDMFTNCNNLKGQCNTSYNNNYTDSSYARLDICNKEKGYFTNN